MNSRTDDPIGNKAYNQPADERDETLAKALDEPPVEEGLQKDLTRRLADRLIKQQFHPVLLFGTRFSGKSTLLASLLGYIKRDPDAAVAIDVGEWLVPTSSEFGARLYDDALSFFHHTVHAFLEHRPPPPTRSMDPFFIPVVFTPSDKSMPSVKFAFLESKGEWYHAQETPGKFQQFREEIAEVLMQYTNGLSVIHMAPYSTNERADADGNDDDAALYSDIVDNGLLGAITMYRRLRKTSLDLDRHLYLLSKWDVHTQQGIRDPEFLVPDVRRVQTLLGTKFFQSWTAYLNMPLGDPPGRRYFMQYCAGLINQNQVRAVAERDRAALDRYPRTVWNWLYANATASEGAPSVLYQDVVRPPPVMPTPMQKVMHMLGIG